MILNKEYLISLLSYNPDTGNFLWIVNRGHNKTKNTIAGCIRDDNRISISIHGKKYWAHRLIWLYIYGRWPHGCIDHINGNSSDNRFLNLRECSMNENSFNMKKHKNNTSGYKGIIFVPKINKWEARIRTGAGNKRLVLGCFETKELAANAYISASKIYHGQFSVFER